MQRLLEPVQLPIHTRVSSIYSGKVPRRRLTWASEFQNAHNSMNATSEFCYTSQILMVLVNKVRFSVFLTSSAKLRQGRGG